MKLKRITPWLRAPAYYQRRAVLAVVNLFLLFFLVILLVTNQVLLSQLQELMGQRNFFSRLLTKVAGAVSQSSNISLSGDLSSDVVKLVISRGTPTVYGQELGVSFEQVQAAINVLQQFDPTYGRQKITLAKQDLQRYITVGSKIACEYCCGAKTLVTPTGEAACGWAPPPAMRGVAAYFI